jgi:hypothetical protein
MCVCVLSFVQVAAFRWADTLAKGSYRFCKQDYGTEEEARAQQNVVVLLMNECIISRQDISFVPLLLFALHLNNEIGVCYDVN